MRRFTTDKFTPEQRARIQECISAIPKSITDTMPGADLTIKYSYGYIFIVTHNNLTFDCHLAPESVLATKISAKEVADHIAQEIKEKFTRADAEK